LLQSVCQKKMSRKSRGDKSPWKTPSVYAFVGDYGPFRAKRFEPIEQVLVILYDKISRCASGPQHHTMYDFAGQAQKRLLKSDDSTLGDQDTDTIRNGILVIDVRYMFDTDQELAASLKKETEDSNLTLTKGFGKSILRLFQRLHLRNIVLAAEGELCALALKLHKVLHEKDSGMISELHLSCPVLTARFINTHLGAPTQENGKKTKPVDVTPLKLLVETMNSRVDILRGFFPSGTTEIAGEEQTDNYLLGFAPVSENSGNGEHPECKHGYDADYRSTLGQSLFATQITVEMNRYTKQYERNCEDITKSLTDMIDESHTETDVKTINWSSCETHIGALVLRGNRCILVRSLQHEWIGMRIPSLPRQPEESPADTIGRILVEFTEAGADDVTFLPQVLPVSVFAPNGRPILVHLYAAYATEPPPRDSPLEPDVEDDESTYDWYTYTNAMQKVDAASTTALQIMALNLVQCVKVGIVPTKWGGVFGQEMKMLDVCITTPIAQPLLDE